MKILLIDADSVIPNIALMKLSYFHKKRGDIVEFMKLNIPFYPNKPKKHHFIDTFKYDKVYCSVIFENSIKYIHGKEIIFGGTGYDLTTTLPDEIEYGECDYSLYPNNNISYGFISRGCIRNCYFCKVPQKEGYIHQVNTIDDIVRHEKVRFLDNNILALENHTQIFEELIDRKIRCSFNEGLDIRLINDVNSNLLHDLYYYPRNYIFAFDDINLKSIIAEKLELLDWANDWDFRFYVYINPNMPLEHTINRVEFLKKRKILPYITRDISCWGSKHEKFYTDIASYCNQPNIFKTHTFEQFMNKRCSNVERVNDHVQLYYKYAGSDV